MSQSKRLTGGGSRILMVIFAVVQATIPGGQERSGATRSGVSWFTGILYGNSKGTSGGIVRLVSEGQEKMFAYQKPFPYDFSSSDCHAPGAIWSVKYRENTELRGGAYPEIVKARCSGKFDERVRSAAIAVNLYLRYVAEGRYAQAYQLMDASWQAANSFETFVESLAGIDFSGFLKWRPECVEVAKLTSDSAIVYAVGCFVRPKKGGYFVAFHLRWDVKQHRWRIQRLIPDTKGVL